MRYLKLICMLMAVYLLMNSCSHVDESERFIYVEPASVNRAVLIEDFTGQRCVNCPNASEEIERLTEQYGEDHIIAVSIHSGPLAVYSQNQVVGLRTELGDTYYDHWKVEVEPSALINRRSGVVTLNQWSALVYDELQVQTYMSLGLDCHLTETGDISMAVHAEALEPVQGKLQVWLTEDGIVAPQMMPDGTMNSVYEHHHVLRAAVNGVWGEEVDWDPGEVSEIQYTVHPQVEWDVEQLSVVAFVYDSEGVLQIVRQRVSFLNR